MSAIAETAPVSAAVSKGFDLAVTKLQKQFEAKDATIRKQAAEIAALKAQLHEAKASNSRIRRIPKKAAAAVAEPASA